MVSPRFTWKAPELSISQKEALAKDLEFFKANPQELEDFLTPAFTTPADKVVDFERSTYKRLFYNEGADNAHTSSPRRYFQNPDILGWNFYEMLETAEKAGKAETYEAYTSYVYSRINKLTTARLIIVMSIVLKDAWTPEGYDGSFLEAMKLFYANAFLLTPWEGKRKEAIAATIIREYLGKREELGVRLVKTQAWKDQKYKVDFVLLKGQEALAGISIKGLSWFHAQQSGRSSYQSQGEKAEKAGHKAFKKDFGLNVKIIVSDKNRSLALLPVLGGIKELIAELEKAGKL